MTSSSFMTGSIFAAGSNYSAVGSGGGTYGTTVTGSPHGHGFTLTAAQQGWTYTAASGTAGAQTISGDTETRPHNVGVNYIIKI
jgi:hypothetical protein